MTTKTLYIKKGKKYVPAYELYDYNDLWGNSLPQGYHLLIVSPGSKSLRYGIAPETANLYAAITRLEPAIEKAVKEAHEARPSVKPATLAQKKAWENLEKTLGDSAFYLSYDSMHEVTQKIVNAILEESK